MFPILHPKTRREVALPAELVALLVCPFNPGRPPARRSAFPNLAAALLFSAIGIFAACQCFPVFLHATRTHFWPTAPGLVTSSHTVVARGGGSRAIRRSLSLSYRFQVEGRTFDGSAWCSGAGSGPFPHDGEQEAAIRYPEGRRVEVRFNPSDPADCVLETTVAGTAWTFAIVATAALTLGGLWFMEGGRILRASRRRRPESA